MIQFDSMVVNGDSYSAASADIGRVYSDYLREYFPVPVYNYAVPGSSNDRIFRSTIEYVNQHLENSHRPLVIVGLSFIRRIEVWYYGNREITVPDSSQSPNSRLVTLDFLLNEKIASADQKSMVPPDLEVHKKLTDFYTNVYLLSNWLEKLQLPYLFFSAARNTDCPPHFFPYDDALSTTQWCKNNPRIYNLHDFCIMNWALENDPQANATTGHLSGQGHEKFSKVLKNILEDLNETI